MHLSTPPTTEAGNATPDVAPERRIARVARGGLHVRAGVATATVGTVAMATIAAVGAGAGEPTGVNGWLGTLIGHAVLAAALLSASRVARALLIVWGCACLLAVAGLVAVSVLRPGHPWPLGTPLSVMATCTGLIGAGSLLATLSPAADAWYTAQRVARAERKRAKSLADWRKASG